MLWQGAEQDLTPKLNRVIGLIDSYYADGYTVSLLGTSAGGSAVVNVFAMRKEKIHRVINVCGRLRKGKNVLPSLEQVSRKSKSFYDSVIRCEENLKMFTSEDCKEILTFRPLFDELVPSSTVPVLGATNVLLPTIEHVLSIALAMTLYSSRIRRFLTST